MKTKINIITILLFFLLVPSVSASENFIKTKTADVTVSNNDSFGANEIPKIEISQSSTLYQKIVDIIGGPSNNLRISIINPNEKEIVNQVINDQKLTLTVDSEELIPGKYDIKINGEKLSSFSWGVLVVNTNKDVYYPNENIYIQMASLDEKGHTLCDSQLQLTLDDVEIPINKGSECGVNNVTDEPDYFANYQTDKIGSHKIKVTNLSNNYSYTNTLTVKEDIPFEIERIGATRINPFRSDYKMIIKIKANQAFNGEIKEQLPNNFELVNSVNSWQESFEIGEEKTFEYIYKSPAISPELFFIGKLKIGNYEESRFWQIASDAVDTNSPTTNTGSWTNPTNAYADGTNYANITSGAPSASHTYGTYGFSLGTNRIDQVRVRYDAHSFGGVSQSQSRSGSDITGDEANSGAFTTAPLFSKVNDGSDSTFIVGVTNGGGNATFNFNAFNVPTESNITDISVTFRARNNTGTAAANGAGVLKVNGTYYRPTGRTVPTNAQAIGEYTDTWATNPNTSAAWTIADINGSGSNPLQAFGVGGSDFNPDVNFYEVYATVTYTTADNEQINVDVSWDGGTSWSSKQDTNLTGSEATYWYDVTAATAWTPTKLNDTNLKVRITATTVGDAGDVRVDWIPVEVTSTPTVTLGGTVYTNESGTNIGANKTVNLKVNGAGTYTAETDASGVWSISGVAVTSGQVVTVYLDNETEEGTTVLVSDGTAKSDIHIYQNRTSVRHDTGSSITPDNLFAGDDTDDDVKYLVSASSNGNLTIDSGFELHVWAGKTLDLSGGNLTTQGGADVHLDDGAIITLDTATNTIAGDILIDDTSLANINANTTINGGDITILSGGDLASSTGTVTMGASGTIGGGGAGSTVQLTNLTISSGTTTLGADADNILVINGDVNVSAGATLAMNNKTLDINGGNLTTTSTGSITCTSCTAGGITLSGDGSTNGIGGGSGAITLYSIVLDGATNSTSIGTNPITVLDDVTIGTNRTLQAYSSGVLNIAGDWSNSGTFTANNSTVNWNGADSGTQALTGNSTFYNFSVSTSGNSAGRTVQFAGSSTTTVTGTWTISGAVGKVITLQSSDTNSWTINPTIASVDYSSVSRSTNTGVSFCATHTTDGGNNSGWDISITALCNVAPNTPSLDFPTDTATGVNRLPTLLTTTTDVNSDYVKYKIELCTNLAMSTGCQTFDQTASQTGWSGQNADSGNAYTSGTQASYTIQTILDASTTYYWRSYAKDPLGTDTWSATQTPYSFTTAIPLDFNFKGLNLKGVNIQ